MKEYILCESSLDFKYKMIFSKLDKDFVIIEGGFIKLMKVLIRNKSFYHIRYIKNRGFILTFFRLVLIYFCTKISNSKIIFTCHNIYEHNFKSRLFNDFIRNFVVLISNHIFVFHKDLINYLPTFSKNKISVATFGNYKKFIENQTLPNKDFQKNYSDWLNQKNIKSPDLISISAAKRNNLEFLIDGVINTQISTLIIAPNSKIDLPNEASDIFIYKKFVFLEVKTILNTQNNFVGFIGHENISVPTSLYMYASYNIPIIAFNIEPVNSIITMYQLGILIKNSEELEKAYYTILDNYNTYVENAVFFLKENSWEKSAFVHKDIFKC